MSLKKIIAATAFTVATATSLYADTDYKIGLSGTFLSGTNISTEKKADGNKYDITDNGSRLEFMPYVGFMVDNNIEIAPYVRFVLEKSTDENEETKVDTDADSTAFGFGCAALSHFWDNGRVFLSAGGRADILIQNENKDRDWDEYSDWNLGFAVPFVMDVRLVEELGFRISMDAMSFGWNFYKHEEKDGDEKESTTFSYNILGEAKPYIGIYWGF